MKDGPADIIIKTTEDLTAGAAYSPCMQYRYALWRQFTRGLLEVDDVRTCCFLMLNPSTADHQQNDPTVTRCCQHAMRWGFDELYVMNLFAWRATDPEEMKRQAEPIGKLNDNLIRSIVSDAAMTVLAYGNHGSHRERHLFVDSLPADKLFFFTKNMSGLPKHPLYVSKKADLHKWADGQRVTLKAIQAL